MKYCTIILCISLFWVEYVKAAPSVQNVESQENISNDDHCSGSRADSLRKIRNAMNDSEMLKINSIQAYIVPMTDAHQSEYIAEHDKRLQYITGFTGSAGEAVITADDAAMWTDSRYFLQAEQQLDLNCWKLMKSGLPGVLRMADWLKYNLPTNSTVGIDPRLIKANDYRELEKTIGGEFHRLESIDINLVDIIWTDQPSVPDTQIIPLALNWSGKISIEKVNIIKNQLYDNKADAIVATNLDDVAWLLNLRGSDIPYNPLFFSYVLLSRARDQDYFFVDQRKLSEAAKKQLAVELPELNIQDYDRIYDVLKEVANLTSQNIIVPTSVSKAIASIIPESQVIQLNTIADIKTVKNPIEAKNMENAHIRDGIAIIQYLHWLNETIDISNITELLGSAKLGQFRAIQDNFQGISFEAISAVGEHAAMAHYSPTPDTDKQITRNEIYLIDSGGHYWDGTTDTTRTVHFGNPTDEEKMFFTLVLKGFIALATSVFPKSTPLSYLDNMARRALWQKGFDYGHGTGHGVGMYLSVHEYPPLINAKGTNTLKENVFTSNEPGYYKDYAFGIRIEDVIQVIKSDNEKAFNGQGALTFRSITYVPLQTKLMQLDLLTNEEIIYINAYNNRVLDTIGAIFLKRKSLDVYEWLRHETLPIKFPTS